MEQCPPGCPDCSSTFRHLSRGQLHEAESDIAGMGLSAKVTISGGQMIIPFKGCRSQPKTATNCDGYALQLDSRTWITPKGIPRYVNHSCEPNAAFMKWTNHRKQLMISIVALKEIPKGVEISVSYGEHHDPSTGRQKCNCRATSCVTKCLRYR